MRTVAILLIVLMSLYMVSGTVAAADTKAANTAKAGIDIIKGKITSIDTTKNTIVVKELKTKTEKTIAVDPKVIVTLTVGDAVKIESKTGSNVADSVKVIHPKK